MSKLLGEHVGGSAVRSICYVSKLHIIPSATTNVPDGRSELNAADEDKDNPTLLISVGAKRVLTSWLLKSRKLDNKTYLRTDNQHDAKELDDQFLSSMSSSMTFQWLSTDMPTKYSITHRYTENNVGKAVDVAENGSKIKIDAEAGSLVSEGGTMNLVRDKHEDDWRYLAVTAFLVKCAGSRLEEMPNICVLILYNSTNLKLKFYFVYFSGYLSVLLLLLVQMLQLCYGL